MLVWRFLDNCGEVYSKLITSLTFRGAVLDCSMSCWASAEIGDKSKEKITVWVTWKIFIPSFFLSGLGSQ